MALIEECSSDEECELEENPGEGGCALEENAGEGGELELDDSGECELELELELEDNPDEAASGVVLQEQPDEATGDPEEEEEEDEWEIPFAYEVHRPVDALSVDVKLFRKDGERLGLVLDEQNVVVALRDGTPAERSGEIFVGDKVLAVQGVACTDDKRVAVLLRELPDAAVYTFTLKRALSAGAGDGISTDVVDHGPLLSPEEIEAFQQREMEARRKLRDALPEEERGQVEPRNLTESKYAPPPRLPRSLLRLRSPSLLTPPPYPDPNPTRYFAKDSQPSPAALQQMKDMWYRQARGELKRRLNAAEMLKDEGNDKFSEGEYKDALEEYDYALDMFKYEMANLVRDQQAAELGDEGRGLGSEDLPRIQKVRYIPWCYHTLVLVRYHTLVLVPCR